MRHVIAGLRVSLMVPDDSDANNRPYKGQGWLGLSLKRGETLQIGDDVEIVVSEKAKNGRMRLAVRAPGKRIFRKPTPEDQSHGE